MVNCLMYSSPMEPGGQAASVLAPGVIVSLFPSVVYVPVTRLQSAVMDTWPCGKNSSRYLFGSSGVLRVSSLNNEVVHFHTVPVSSWDDLPAAGCAGGSVGFGAGTWVGDSVGCCVGGCVGTGGGVVF